jgi:hypothetical protein
MMMMAIKSLNGGIQLQDQPRRAGSSGGSGIPTIQKTDITAQV